MNLNYAPKVRKVVNNFIQAQELMIGKEKEKQRKAIEDYEAKIKKLEEENETLRKQLKEVGDVQPQEGSVQDSSGEGQK